MEIVNEYLVWKLCMEILYGSHSLKSCVELLYGNLAWKSCVEILYGNYVWKSFMEVLYVNFVWKSCIEILHGSWSCANTPSRICNFKCVCKSSLSNQQFSWKFTFVRWFFWRHKICPGTSGKSLYASQTSQTLSESFLAILEKLWNFMKNILYIWHHQKNVPHMEPILKQ